MSIADKLIILRDSKDAIAYAIARKGVPEASEHGYSSFAADIDKISRGGEIELQEKTVTPTASQQNVLPDPEYGGLSKVTVNAAPLETKSIVPTKGAQTVLPSSGKIGLSSVAVEPVYLTTATINPQTIEQIFFTGEEPGMPLGFSQVTVNAVTSAIDPKIKAENIKKDVTILGVKGTFEGGGGDTYSIVPETLTWQHNQYVTIGLDIDAQGNLNVYKASGSGTANNLVICYPQSDTYDADDEITKIDIPQAAGTYEMPITVWWDNQSGVHNDHSNHTITYTVVNSSGPNLQEKTATPTTSQQSITPDAGYDGLSKVTVNAVTSAIDSNIKAANIKDGVTILGVTGTFEGEGGMNTQVNTTFKKVSNTSLSASGLNLTVAKTGTYTISWAAWRNTTSGTNLTRIYVNGSAKGTDHTTWTDSYGQVCVETNIALTAGQTVEVYARSRGTSYAVDVANLVIQQTA